MPKFFRIFLITFLPIMLISFSQLFAQYIIEQTEYDLPVSFELVPENFEADNFQAEALFFLDLPEEKLRAAAREQGEEIETETLTMFIDGDNFAIETVSPTGKATVVSDAKSSNMYYILWAKKKVMVMNASEMKEMEQSANKMIEEAMKNVPPEMREQYMAEMKKQKSKPAAKYTAKPTGKKATKYGMACEQYLLTRGEEDVSIIWAAKDNSGLTKLLESTKKQFEKIFPSENGEDEFDEWDAIPGKIPVEIRKYQSDAMTGSPTINVSAITKMEKKTPPPDKFYVPTQKDGFTHGSMQDMMMEMMQENPED